MELKEGWHSSTDDVTGRYLSCAVSCQKGKTAMTRYARTSLPGALPDGKSHCRTGIYGQQNTRDFPALLMVSTWCRISIKIGRSGLLECNHGHFVRHLRNHCMCQIVRPCTRCWNSAADRRRPSRRRWRLNQTNYEKQPDNIESRIVQIGRHEIAWSYDMPGWNMRDFNGNIMRQAYVKALMEIMEMCNHTSGICNG
jgi:hypothetical protein